MHNLEKGIGDVRSNVFSFDEFKTGGLHEKQAVATFGNLLTICLDMKEHQGDQY